MQKRCRGNDGNIKRYKMTITQKLKRLDYLSSLPYLDHTSEDWDEELRLECELDHLNQLDQ